MSLLQPITTTATPEFYLAWQLYEEAFPPEERRSLEQQILLLSHPAYRFIAIEYQQRFAGVFGIWQLPGFTFLEHFAVVQELRGRGVGAEALRALLAASHKTVLLETEPPTTTIASRRIRFYRQAGFHLHAFDYRQPPYSPGKPWVELRLMSYPDKLTADALEEAKRQLYQQVYGVQG